MKRTLFSVVLACGFMQSMNAQVIDTVTTGQGYGNNIWYSLQNDDQASVPSNNWDIAFATTFAQTNPLATSILFNYKTGSLYAMPGSNPANFATLDTTGLSALTPLYNSDTTWTKGAFNRTPSLGQFDYGWGNYNTTTHGISANRIFVIKYANNTYKKLTIDFDYTAGEYQLKSSNLDNTGLQTKSIAYATYATKNFVYYNLGTNAIIDREPAAASWDLTFLQYNTAVMGTQYPVAGIFQNHGVTIAKVYPVNNTATFTSWANQNYSAKINTIGYNWKITGQSGGVVIEDSTVFFVKAKTGDLWKVIMTGFVTGSGPTGTGKYIFSKQKLSTASVNEVEENVFMTIYPNPANESVTLVLDNKAASSVAVYNVLGALVYSTEVEGNGLQTVQVPVSEMNNGIYHVVCTSNGKATTQKLLVQH